MLDQFLWGPLSRDCDISCLAHHLVPHFILEKHEQGFQKNPELAEMQTQSHLIRLHTVFHSDCKYMLTAGMLQVNSIKIGDECKNIQHDKG